ncbi:MAG: alanine dehydrogenase [Firmicutes bacterium]|nr:alanine dehydrogenase [Bacillota bacterium]
MKISLPKEIKSGEFRVAIIPSNVARLVDAGHTVYVQKDAGAAAGYPDEEYIAAGAEMVETEKDCFDKAEMVVKVKEILPEEFGLLREDQVLFTYIHSSTRRAMTEEILNSKCIGFAMEDMMDDRGHFILLEPMSRIAGEIGFLYGLFYSQTTFGGKGKAINGSIGVKPMKVVIFGAGNVGVAAARLALGLNADVVLMDVDLLKLEDVLANKLPNVRTCYSNRANITKEIKDADLVLNCVKWVPGLTLISKDMLEVMQPNSMIVDIDAEPGAGIESSRFTTHADPVYVEKGIRHICIPNLPSAVSNTASAALSNASIKFIMEIAE